MSHKLDKIKCQELLLKRGWHRGPNNEWVLPLNLTFDQFQRDWEECLVESIICSCEQQKIYNEAFIKKHSTPKR
jgi:hypothetical protein